MIETTYYIRDAQGNVMATYLNKNEGSTETYHLTERPIYGSSRLGMLREKVNMLAEIPSASAMRTMRYGLKHYELTNHLGNVTTILTGQKVPFYENTFLTYKPQIVQSMDYSPFGVTRLSYDVTPIDANNPVDEGYRYGFNGMEKDDEVKGAGNSLDFGARVYDSRLGRWLSLDQLQAKYPGYSPYNFTLGNPILFRDPDGRDVDLSLLTSLYHQAALQELAGSETFTQSLKRWMKAGQSVSIPGSNVVISADVDGDRSNDLLRLVSAKDVGGGGRKGITLSYIMGTSIRVPHSSPNNHGSTVQKGVRTEISILEMSDVDESMRTIAHEQLVHADQDADRLTEIDNLSKEQKLDLDIYQHAILDIANTGDDDHDKLKIGKISKLESTFKQLKRPDLYEKDKSQNR